MISTLRSPLLSIALVLAIGCGFAHAADKQQSQSNGMQSQQQAQALNKSQAGKLALQQLGGKILKIQSQNNHGQQGYKVKLLQSSGHVKQVWVDANSGKIH